MESSLNPNQSPLSRRALGFWHWWSQELTALLPKRWIGAASGNTGPLVAIEQGEVVLLEVRLGSLAVVDRVRLEGLDAAGRHLALTRILSRHQAIAASPLRVVLDDALVLTRRVKLPAAAAENLRGVLGFEMDRHTPFKADQVYFDYYIVARDAASITVDLAVAQRHAVDAIQAQFRELGGRVGRVIPSADAGASTPRNLLQGSPGRVEHGFALSQLNLVLSIVFGVALLAAIALPIWNKRMAAHAYGPLLTKVRNDASGVQATRAEVEKLVADANYLLYRKHVQVPVVVLLEDLSRAMPDDTWVSLLEIKTGNKVREVVLSGETGSSSKLVQTFEQVSSLQNASFRSPLTKGAGPNTERFVLGAEVRPRTPPTAATEPVPAATPAPIPTPTAIADPAAVPGATTPAAGTPASVPPAPPAAPGAETPAKEVGQGKPPAPLAPVPKPEPVRPADPAPATPAEPRK